MGWFVDATPVDSSEFTVTRSVSEGGSAALQSAAVLQAPAASPAAGKYDLLTVLLHEMGHLAGFHDLEGAEIGDDHNHVDPLLHPFDLMGADLQPGERRLPSALDAEILDEIRAQQLDDVIGLLAKDRD
jgi:hypothetical protein